MGKNCFLENVDLQKGSHSFAMRKDKDLDLELQQRLSICKAGTEPTVDNFYNSPLIEQ